ncbi:MAG TPA: hypothetical protein VNE19_08245 [Methylomirabilota bacterium]|nr:hypothetical protein [Methylomirabilota bacterium]
MRAIASRTWYLFVLVLPLATAILGIPLLVLVWLYGWSYRSG